MVILLCGGDKTTQTADIKLAKTVGKRGLIPWLSNSRNSTFRTKTRKEQIAYLKVAIEDGDPSFVAAMIGEIAKARGVSQFAKETGLSREAIYKAFRPGGNPTIATL